MISCSKPVPNLFTFQVCDKFFVGSIQTLNEVRREALPVLIRRIKIRVVLLDHSPPGPPHRAEAGTVWKFKVSIVAGKDRTPVMELLSCTSSSWTKSVAQHQNWQRATRENMGIFDRGATPPDRMPRPRIVFRITVTGH